MPDYLDTIKPVVRALKPYSLAVNDAPIKLNQNENPFGLPPRIKEESIRRFMDMDWGRYPDFVPTALMDKLSAHAAWTPEGIIVGNGSNEILNAVFAVTVAKGEKVLLSEPTFAIYRQTATVFDAEVVSVPLTADFEHDTPALRRAIEQYQPVVTVICSPNNPTGNVITERDLKSLLEVARGLVVLDEAYWEFAGHTFVSLMNEHPNLIVTRTFSKALALAALRVGYLMSAPALATEIRKAVLPYNINRFSQIVAETALEHYDAELAPLVARILTERCRVFDLLSGIEGIAPHPTHANFTLTRTTRLSPRRLYDELFARDILVRDVSGNPMLKSYIRIGVGTPEETDALVEALKSIHHF